MRLIFVTDGSIHVPQGFREYVHTIVGNIALEADPLLLGQPLDLAFIALPGFSALSSMEVTARDDRLLPPFSPDVTAYVLKVGLEREAQPHDRVIVVPCIFFDEPIDITDAIKGLLSLFDVIARTQAHPNMVFVGLVIMTINNTCNAYDLLNPADLDS